MSSPKVVSFEKFADFVKVTNPPLDDKRQALCDLYIALPKASRFVMWFAMGEMVPPDRVDAAREHASRGFYCFATQYQSLFADDNADKAFDGDRRSYESARLVTAPGQRLDPLEDFSSIIFADPSVKELKIGSVTDMNAAHDYFSATVFQDVEDLYCSIMTSPAKLTIEETQIEALSQKLLSIVAPEAGSFRERLLSIAKYVDVMKSSSAIFSISVILSIATGQRSRNVFRDLAYSCLLMDLSLIGVSDEVKLNAIISPESLSAIEKRVIAEHPRTSFEIIQKKFFNMSDVVSQMVIGHHELMNGKGYPRGLRSELLSPMVRMLSLAVGIYEEMVVAKHSGESATLLSVVDSFCSDTVDVAKREHNVGLCRRVGEYLNSDRF